MKRQEKRKELISPQFFRKATGGHCEGEEATRSRIKRVEMEDSSTSFMKVDVRGEPHCRTKRFHRKARRVSERASERAVDMSAYYGQAAFIRQKRTFKGGGEIVNSISWKEPELRHPFNIFSPATAGVLRVIHCIFT